MLFFTGGKKLVEKNEDYKAVMTNHSKILVTFNNKYLCLAQMCSWGSPFSKTQAGRAALFGGSYSLGRGGKKKNQTNKQTNKKPRELMEICVAS